ncbi:MAG: hypothetical protein LBR21_05680 [Propionibacteriaceae bacterium]|jgi:hypothetical protein|nr:hypothetical protein [Propionibacteriaceae bacterium]
MPKALVKGLVAALVLALAQLVPAATTAHTTPAPKPVSTTAKKVVVKAKVKKVAKKTVRVPRNTYIRTEAKVTAPLNTRLKRGSKLTITCYVHGDVFHGVKTWYKTAYGYAPHYQVLGTPNRANVSKCVDTMPIIKPTPTTPTTAPTPTPSPAPTIEPKPTPTPSTYSVTTTAKLRVRSGPYTSTSTVKILDKGVTTQITCWVKGETIKSNPYWDKLADGSGYVSDYYVKSGGLKGVPQCASTPAEPATGQGMTLKQAEDYVAKYASLTNDQAKKIPISVGCGGYLIKNCVSFSQYFVNVSTTVKDWTNTSNGNNVVKRLQEIYGWETGTEPKPYAIFSTTGPSDKGHTGVVLGVNADGSFIIGEAGCSASLSWIAARTKKTSDYGPGTHYGTITFVYPPKSVLSSSLP